MKLNRIPCFILASCIGIAIPAFASNTSALRQSSVANANTSLRPADAGNFDKMKTLFEQAREVPVLSDFDSYHEEVAHPLHCVSYESGSDSNYISHPLVASRVVTPATPGNGPLIPPTPAKVEIKLLFEQAATAVKMIADDQTDWEAVSNQRTATDLVVKVGLKVGSETIVGEADLRKNGDYIAYKLVQKLGTDPQTLDYGYCYRSTEESWVAAADVRTGNSDDGFVLHGGWAFDADQATAESAALSSCTQAAGAECTSVRSVQNGCISDVMDGDRNSYVGIHQGSTDDLPLAIESALELCKAQGGTGCTEYTEQCSDTYEWAPGAAQ